MSPPPPPHNNPLTIFQSFWFVLRLYFLLFLSFTFCPQMFDSHPVGGPPAGVWLLWEAADRTYRNPTPSRPAAGGRAAGGPSAPGNHPQTVWMWWEERWDTFRSNRHPFHTVWRQLEWKETGKARRKKKYERTPGQAVDDFSFKWTFSRQKNWWL